ncbi:MAG TPA: ABC transporter substrate-binding protein [Anaerolineae bacterium]|nr:ABC transporter substrate-binding protein [Anaerolineae bacterium]
MKGRMILLLTGLALAAMVLSACPGTTTTVAPTQPPPPTAPPATQPPSPTEAPTDEPVTEGDPYVVGAFFSTTGPVSTLGQPEANTVTMLVEQINAAGGIMGPDGLMHKLEVKMYDDQSDATTAVEVAKKLVDEDKVPVIVGGSGSPASIAVNETVSTASIPFISVASSSAIVTKEDGSQHEWVFKTPQQNYPVAQVQGDWLQANGVTKVASLGVNNAFGADSMAALRRVAEELGIEIVYEGTFEPGDTDFSAQLTQIAGSDAEAVIIHATPGEGAPLTVQYRDLGLEMPILHNHGIGNRAFIDTAGEAAEGVLFPIGKLLVADQLPDDDPQKETLLTYQADYEGAYGTPPSTFGGHAWDALMMVKAALEAVGPDPAAIRDYLENEIKDFVGISGVFNIGKDDHTGIAKESLVLVEIKDGTWVFVDPADYANVP